MTHYTGFTFKYKDLTTDGRDTISSIPLVLLPNGMYVWEGYHDIYTNHPFDEYEVSLVAQEIASRLTEYKHLYTPEELHLGKQLLFKIKLLL